MSEIFCNFRDLKKISMKRKSKYSVCLLLLLLKLLYKWIKNIHKSFIIFSTDFLTVKCNKIGWIRTNKLEQKKNEIFAYENLR